MLGEGLGVLAAIALALFVGSTMQAVVGLGIGLVAAPVITLLAPGLMPGLLIMLALLLPCLTLVRDHRDIDWHGLNWSLPARVAGTGVGVWVVTAFSTRQLGIAIGLVVLLAVAVTARAVTVPINHATLSGAGFIGGVTGTATSIGGPPFALLYQHRPAQQIRTTMAVYFLVGAALSLGGLVLAGDVTRHQVGVALLLAPVLALGVLAGVPLRRRLPVGVVRPAVLAVSAASALVLLARSLLS